MGCAEKHEGTGTNSFLPNSSAVSSTNPFCPLGRLQNQNQKQRMNIHSVTTSLLCKPIRLGQRKKIKPFFAAFKTADGNDLGSRGEFAEEQSKRKIIRKH